MSAKTINIDELERLALAARQGKWIGKHPDGKYRNNGWSLDSNDDALSFSWVEVQSEGETVAIVVDKSCDLSGDAQYDKDAAYIAAANPATMLQLIAIIRERLASALVEQFYHPDAEADLEAQASDSSEQFKAWLSTQPFSPCGDPFVAAELAWKASRDYPADNLQASVSREQADAMLEQDKLAVLGGSQPDIHQQLETERARNAAILAAFHANLRKAGAHDDVIDEIINRIEVK